MNNESIRILSSTMDESPDELLDIDAALREHEDGMPDRITDMLSGRVEMMKTVIMDDTLSYGVRLGFIMSTTAMAIAENHGIALSEFYTGMAAQSLAAESAMEIQARVGKLLFGNSEPEGDAPDCHECGVEARWCFHHKVWECPNPACPHTGAVEE